jgi:FkbM family methyltransferase
MMDTYYSQHGEDFLVNKIFAGKPDGYYVEIGCLDGIEFSNTYYFEKKGWKGACIEAHQDFIGALKKNRPNASIVHCAVGEADKDNVTFYANKIGSLSTLDKNEEERWRKNYKDYFHGFEEQKVPMRTLTTIFKDLKADTIDFVSLDIEGYEVQALTGLDFDRFKPKVFIIEYKDETHKGKIEAILFKHDYHYLSRIGCNLFYSLDPAHKKIVTAPYETVHLLQVDMDGKKHWHKADQLTPTLLRKVKSVVKKSFIGKGWKWLEKVKQDFMHRLQVPSYKRKRAILERYRKDYNLKVLVETGTFLGDTVEFFKKKFDRVYSIELSEELYTDAKKRFEKDENVTILRGDSGEVLQRIVPSINAPALFWLDGHYSYEFYVGDRYIKTALGDKITPVVKELSILLNNKHQHLVLVDDARLFNGCDDYPEIREISEMVDRSPHRYKMSVQEDIIRIIPAKFTS